MIILKVEIKGNYEN